MTDEPPTTPATTGETTWLADIGFAVDRVKRGRRAWRSGWAIAAYLDLVDVAGEPVIQYTARNAGEPVTWFPTSADLLATDWQASAFESNPPG